MRELGKILTAGYGVVQFELLTHEWLKNGIEIEANIELENGVTLKNTKIIVDSYQLDSWEIDIENEDEYAILRVALGLEKCR